jgi:hypothetical protein
MKALRPRKRTEATPSLEHRVERLFRIALNFNERFVAIETAIQRLQNRKSADTVG